MNLLTTFQLLFLLALLISTSTYLILRVTLRILGQYLIHTNKEKRQLILGRLLHQTSNITEKGFIIGFFHPFCNAGGGGERVLWAAIRATQKKYPHSICIVYTGDHDADKESIIKRVKERFDISLEQNRILFLYLNYRNLVSAELYPHFTLLLQSLGSLPLVFSALSLLVPDIFIDTMGYSFSYPFVKALFGKRRVPVGAYVHYPTISADMLDSLDQNQSVKMRVKKLYWRLFARIYRSCGEHVDVVSANSTWTARHISQLWELKIEGDGKDEKDKQEKDQEPDRRTVKIIYPPCSVERITSAVSLTNKRNPHIIYIAQFRPEKRHELILRSFAKFLQQTFSPKFPHKKQNIKLILLGSVRTNTDADTKLVYSLRILARELSIQDHVEFITDASYSQILHYLQTCSVGTNAMWNEHFGIGIVEYLAAGLMCVVHDSGGPKMDIVEDGKTGWHADGIEGFAEGYRMALEISGAQERMMRERCRVSSSRFGEEVFEKRWVGVMERLVGLREGWRRR